VTVFGSFLGMENFFGRITRKRGHPDNQRITRNTAAAVKQWKKILNSKSPIITIIYS